MATLRGIKEVTAWKKDQHKKNLDEWYRRNPWAHGSDYRDQRDFCDEDYPGSGLETAFFEIPNM